MWSTRRLKLPDDLPLYTAMYNWLADSPQWRRETEAVFGTLDWDKYLEAADTPGRCDIGVFDEGRLVATVILTLTAKDTYEVHFEAAPTADPAVIVPAGHRIRDILFGEYGAKLAYTWTPRWNRGVLAINRAIGFVADNVTMFKGLCRGKPIEWVRYSIAVGG